MMTTSQSYCYLVPHCVLQLGEQHPSVALHDVLLKEANFNSAA